MSSVEGDSVLWDAYRTTRFEALTPHGLIFIRVGEISSDLERLLAATARCTWCFITAWNPASRTLQLEENRARNEGLEKQLHDVGYVVYSGQGCPMKSGWEPEESFLVLGISRAESVQLGHAFGQNAIVWGSVDEPAELLDCR